MATYGDTSGADVGLTLQARDEMLGLVLVPSPWQGPAPSGGSWALDEAAWSQCAPAGVGFSLRRAVGGNTFRRDSLGRFPAMGLAHEQWREMVDDD